LILIISRPRGESIRLLPPPTPAPVIVHVAGAVREPGLHSLPNGSRVKDAIEKSGGLKDSANPDLVNLAMPLEDGMQIWVPALEIHQENDGIVDKATRSNTGDQNVALVNINTASQDELETLSGIGPVIANAIIQFRLENGPFKAIEDIQSVSGIGPVTFDKIKSSITVGGYPGD